MEILGITELIGDEKPAAKGWPGGRFFLYQGQVAGLIRVAVRRAVWQTAQELAGYLEAQGKTKLAEDLRAMTPEELADGIDVSAEIEQGTGDKGQGTREAA